MSFFRAYVPVATRRKRAAKAAKRMTRGGRTLAPVSIDGRGRAIAKTFWGKAWCDNLERYSDYANRLPRGRTYVRNGSVVDLQIGRGSISALVMGSELYEIAISIRSLSPERWRRTVSACSGEIDSLVELLSGRLSEGVMRVVTERDTGLFPAPREIQMRCSCPDWAGLCKHLAATLYGVGARLDERPELTFLLRGVDALELVDRAAVSTSQISGARSGRATVADDALGDIFGIEFEREPQARPKAATGARKVPRKRPAEDLAGKLLAHVRRHPGQSITQIALALGKPTALLARPVKQLLTAGSIVKRGVTRATRYFPR
jgi:uncharacterized Zn finger protein